MFCSAADCWPAVQQPVLIRFGFAVSYLCDGSCVGLRRHRRKSFAGWFCVQECVCVCVLCVMMLFASWAAPLQLIRLSVQLSFSLGAQTDLTAKQDQCVYLFFFLFFFRLGGFDMTPKDKLPKTFKRFSLSTQRHQSSVVDSRGPARSCRV